MNRPQCDDVRPDISPLVHVPGRQRIQEPNRISVGCTQIVDTNERRHDIVRVDAVTQTKRVTDLVQGDCSHTPCIESVRRC